MSLLSSTELFKKNLSGTLSECQTIWIQIKTAVLISGYKMFAKVISKSLLAKKEFIGYDNNIYVIQKNKSFQFYVLFSFHENLLQFLMTNTHSVYCNQANYIAQMRNFKKKLSLGMQHVQKSLLIWIYTY